MKKYKLIKEYPGSPELGAIRSDCGTPILQKYFINYPEFWQEIIEKDYEILFQSPGIPLADPKKGYEVVKTTSPKILSVKRLSDGEIFTVGDLITGHSYTDARVIKKIKIRNDETIQLEQKYGNTELAYAIKVKQQLFLTYNGKDIYEGDQLWYVNKENFYYDYFVLSKSMSFHLDTNVYFLTREEAEDYIIRNKPVLSLNKFWEFTCGNGSPNTIEERMIKLIKQRLNLK